MKTAKKYKNQLRIELSRSHWEIVEIDIDSEWWVEEHWKVRSSSKEFGYLLILSFLVDPHTTDSGKSHLISEVLAGTAKPTDPLDRAQAIAELDMRKGYFGEKLGAFLQEIDRHRDALARSRHPGQSPPAAERDQDSS